MNYVRFSTSKNLFNNHKVKYNSIKKNNKPILSGGLRSEGYFKQTLPDKPLISIITVTLNTAELIEKTILNVLNLSYDNIEFIIIDGGSTDGTLDIIKKYNSNIDCWVSDTDKGIYDAMNKGIELSTGDWLYFLNVGDTLHNNLETIVKHLNNENCVYYGDCFWTNEKIIYNGKFNKIKLMQQNICHQSIFYPKKIFDRYQYSLDYKVLADYHLNLRCLIDNDFNFKYMPITIADFDDCNGYSKNNSDKHFDDYKDEFLFSNFPRITFIFYKIRVYYCIFESKVETFLNYLGIKKCVLKFLIAIKIKRNKYV